jgi:hypothetical protein
LAGQGFGETFGDVRQGQNGRGDSHGTVVAQNEDGEQKKVAGASTFELRTSRARFSP